MLNPTPVQLKVAPLTKKETKFKIRYIFLAVILTPIILYGLAAILPETHSYEGGSVYSGDVYNWELQHKEKLKDVIKAENAVWDKKLAECEDERAGAKKKLLANAFDSITNKLSVDQITSLAKKRDTDNCTQIATDNVAFNPGTPDKPETGDSLIPVVKALQFISDDNKPIVSEQIEVYQKPQVDAGTENIIAYASYISGNKLDFIRTLDAENAGTWDVNVKHANIGKGGRVSSTDYGLCQFNSVYYMDFIKSSDFQSPYKQLDKCWGLYQDYEKRGIIGKRFYAYNTLSKKPNIFYLSKINKPNFQ